MESRIPEEIGALIDRLSNHHYKAVEEAVDGLSARLGGLEGDEFRHAAEALCSLFYVDTSERPDLEPAVERAAQVLAIEGGRIVPLLIAQMHGSDIKSHLLLARTLGLIGRDAVPRLRDLLATAEDPYARAFALYALGKISCPEAADALPEVLAGLMHPDKEVRDSAARTLGKIARNVPSETLTPRRRREMFEALLRATRDPQAAVRAKAYRSLGKMALVGLLDDGQTQALVAAARAATGETEHYVWDAAFIVRHEAKEALRTVSP
jgi:HEAT repeat protein